MIGDGLYFTAYFEPRAATTEWYTKILHAFWLYGLSYQPYLSTNKQAIGWEEQLQTTPGFAGFGIEGEEFDGTVQQWLEKVSQYGRGTLEVYDRNLPIQMTLQPNAQFPMRVSKPLQTLGKLELYYDSAYLNPDKSSKDVELPFLQAWHNHLHWAETSCRILQPLYAFSYMYGNLRDEYYLDDAGEHEQIEVPLLQQQLPDLSTMLGREALQYLGPALVQKQKEQVQRMTQHVHTWSQYLPTGGVMLVPALEPFRYGFGIAHYYSNLSRESYRQKEDEEGDRQLERANALFDLYREIFD